MHSFNPYNFVILIVDDNKLNLRFLVDILSNHGYRISFATSGSEALQRLKNLKTDIILLDLMMPEMDGFEVIQQLKSDPNTIDIPVIFITASLDKNDIVKSFELGAVDYITKPFNIPEVQARVKTHLTIKEQRLKLLESEEKLNTIVTHLFDGIIIVNKEGIVLFANPAAGSMLNRKESELIGYNLGIPILVGNAADLEIITPNHTISIIEITTSETQWQGQDVYLISLRDITQRKQLEFNLQEEMEEKQKLIVQLEKLAVIDDLTGIYNRHYLFEILEKEFNRALRYESHFSLLCIDIDNFKIINDTYGHLVGDQALLLVVKEITQHLRQTDYFARLGGDEFIILLPESNMAEAIEFAKKISQSFEKVSMVYQEEILPLTLSIGIDGYQSTDKTYNDAINRADIALYQAKNNGKNQIFPKN